MESSTLKGKAADRGRRYASAAMYGMISQSCCEKESIRGPNKDHDSKHALVRSDRFFVHELECILQRINGEENEAPARPRHPKKILKMSRTNMDQIAKIISVSMVFRQPVQDALTRSEILLRSAEYFSKKKLFLAATKPSDQSWMLKMIQKKHILIKCIE